MKNEELSKEELFERNLEFFKVKDARIFTSVCGIKETHSKLIFDDAGNPDIHFQEGRMYDKPLDEFVQNQIQDYLRVPLRMNYIPPQTGILDEVSSAFNYRILKEAVGEGFQFAEAPRPNDTFFSIVFGIGLGQHIEPLIEATNSKAIILIEPNIEFIYHSMFVTDWKSLGDKLKKDDRYLQFIVERTYLPITNELRNVIRGICPSFFDGAHLYRHYHSSVMEVAIEEFQKDISVVMSGLGFIEDEEFMVRNSYNILENYNKYVFKSTTVHRKMPCFVVGSGPSLSLDLDYIRENQDNAVVISCGTALSLLLSNGIRPDFHVEMENIELVDGVIKKIKNEYGLEGITLLASTTVDPRVINEFDNTVLFFRQNLSSWWIFTPGDWSGLDDVGPTVTNAGLSFAHQIGFRELYFFGMDLGTKDVAHHHAVGSVYDTAITYGGDKFPLERKGNLGGRVFTHSIFIWARSTIEKQVKLNSRGRIHYNCSNGLAFKGVRPKLSKTIKLDRKHDKKVELEDILDSFPLYGEDDFKERWTRIDWAENIHDLIEKLRECCDQEYDPKYGLRFISKMARLLIPLDRKMLPEDSAAIHAIRGSILMVFISAAFYFARVHDAKKLERMREIIYQNITRILDDIDERQKIFFDGLRVENKDESMKPLEDTSHV